ncbi:MAG: GLPGLI family protein [Flavobacteriaceae bacterium]|nr:MAG: GLPGLI family protein [Flavobacteriaceae bacterium]
MKKLQIILLLYSSFIFSQQKFSGIIEYTVKADETFQSNKGKKNLPIFFSIPANFVLKFTENESLYQKQNKSMKIENENKIKISFLDLTGGGSGIFYTNRNSRELILKKEAYGEEFLITHKIAEWEITQETKKIGEYTCYKAIRKYKDYEKKDSKLSAKNSKRISAWFTLQIPVPYGPNLYNGLPGLVLEVNFGKIVFKVTKIILNPTKKIVLKKPSGGIKINEIEYYKKALEIGESIGF